MPLHNLPLKEIFGRSKILVAISWATAEIWHQEAGCPHVSYEFQFSLPTPLGFTEESEGLNLVAVAQ